MIGLAQELGLGDQLRLPAGRLGFFIDGEMHDFNGVADLLRFTPLTPIQRLRLGWFVAQCQLRKSYGRLDDLPLEKWLRRHCGKGLVERIWRPCSTRASSATPRVCPPPTSGRARAGCRPPARAARRARRSGTSSAATSA